MTSPWNQRTVVALSILLAITPVSLAYETPLRSNSIREAYFLGKRSDQKTSLFLGTYIKRMPLPENGAYISDITLYTPYAQVVLNSWMNSSEYSAQQAEKDYGAGDELIRVRVRIEFTPTYSAVQMKHDDDGSGQDVFVPRPETFWKDFRFELIQENTVILPRSDHAAPIYDDGGFRGAEVWQEYDAKNVPSEDTSVRVVTPDGQNVVAHFDLSTLR